MLGGGCGERRVLTGVVLSVYVREGERQVFVGLTGYIYGGRLDGLAHTTLYSFPLLHFLLVCVSRRVMLIVRC